jgi:hypothetical protein
VGGIGKIIRLLKLSATGVLATVLGVVQVATGERQGVVAGFGSFLVAAVVFGFIGYVVFRKPEPDQERAFQFASTKKRSRLLWLGLVLCVAPGLMYLYLYYAMYRAALGAVMFLSIPMWIAGLGCLVAGLMPNAKEQIDPPFPNKEPQ